MEINQDEMAWTDELRLVPVRHHSPRSALITRRIIEEDPPAAILVEGPSDADELVPVLADPETVPPVAILAYRPAPPAGERGAGWRPRTLLWPLAAYSPELVALRVGREMGIPTAFWDLPSGRALARRRDRATGREEVPRRPPDGVSGPGGPSELLGEAARRTGHRSFEELWEATFEAPETTPRAFDDAISAFAEALRSVDPEAPAAGPREAHLLGRVARLVEEGTDPADILVVCGASHAVALREGAIDPAEVPDPEEAEALQVTVVPYSFPRLAEQTGYGAGNRAPRHYQRMYEARGDLARAADRAFVDLFEHLRARGRAVSLADAIEAGRLARTLAGMRGKAGPGLDEVREAATATLCRGRRELAERVVERRVVGRAVGTVSGRVPPTSLVEEFRAEIRAHELPRADEPATVILHLAEEADRRASAFLHRLRVAGVPYARRRALAAGGGWREAAGRAGRALGRMREKWEARWTPATEVALEKRIVEGTTLVDVTAHRVGRRIEEAPDTAGAADALLDALLADAGAELVREGIERVDRRAAADDEPVSLARAAGDLLALLRQAPARAVDVGAVPDLLRRVAARAILRLPAEARIVDDEAARPLLEACRRVAEVVGRPDAPVEGTLLRRTLRDLAGSTDAHPAVAGLALGLLVERTEEREVALDELDRRLAPGPEPGRAARFLGGFLEGNRLLAVTSPAVVGRLDRFLGGLTADAFRRVLPLLRRAFADLTEAETRRLVGRLRIRSGLGRTGGETVLTDEEARRMEGIDEDLDDLLGDLDL